MEIIFLFIILLFIYRKNFFYGLPQNNLEETSYNSYANFYGRIENEDPEFHEKVTKIHNMIVKEKCENIKEIAKKSNCTYQECIIKIQYLKYKNIISGYYVDHHHGYIKKCSPSDKKLIAKYSPYLYGNKLQTKDIAIKLYRTNDEEFEPFYEQVKKDIKYLIDKDLIEGVIYNDIDDKLIYYIDEETDIISISCKHCGAINDVHKGSKKRCAYCNSIIDSKEHKKAEIMKQINKK